MDLNPDRREPAERRPEPGPAERRPELVVIGASWGGLQAVGRLLELLPTTFDLPMALVQHRGAQHSELASLLAHHAPVGSSGGITVAEADDKDAIVPGVLAVAPPDYHLLVEPGSYALSTEAPVRHSRPSIDLLFESAADAYGPTLVGVLLTGANDDGARGLARVAARGGATLVQDPDTAARSDMPRAAIDRFRPDLVAPVEGIAGRLAELAARPPLARTGRPDAGADR